MFWLARPPYLRWLAAGALLTLAAAVDLTERSTTPYPFVAESLAAGEAISGAVIEWRDVPVGLLGDPSTISGFAAHPLQPGEPLVAGAVDAQVTVPAGWWAVPVELPPDAAPGVRVRLIAFEPAIDVLGVVARSPDSGTFSVSISGLVAVPPDAANTVARAVSSGRLIVLMGT